MGYSSILCYGKKLFRFLCEVCTEIRKCYRLYGAGYKWGGIIQYDFTKLILINVSRGLNSENGMIL